MEGIVIGDNGLATDAEGVMDDGVVCACVGEGVCEGYNSLDAVEMERLVQEFVEVCETTVIGVFDGRDKEAECLALVTRVIRVTFETEETEEGRREEEAVDEGAAWLKKQSTEKVDDDLSKRGLSEKRAILFVIADSGNLVETAIEGRASDIHASRGDTDDVIRCGRD